jgi:L-serine dehydratase
MALSVFDLFKIGIGPSSSHTVGPMIAANRFARGLSEDGLLTSTERVTVELFGSLGATGKGHGSVPAVALGLLGERPDAVDPDHTPEVIDTISNTGLLSLLGQHPITFNLADDIILHTTKKARFHSNAMVFRAFEHSGAVVAERTFYSIGGGFALHTQLWRDTPSWRRKRCGTRSAPRRVGEYAGETGRASATSRPTK